MQYFELPVAAHSAAIILARGNMTRLQESIEVFQHRWADVQSALIGVNREQDK